jgi:hypothetical protein
VNLRAEKEQGHYNPLVFIPLDFGHLPRNQLAGKWQPHEGFIAAA